jgi:hypothetical protein
MNAKRMLVGLSRLGACGFLAVSASAFVVGCSGPDNPSIVSVPAPRPATAEEKAEPEGKPKGYGSNSVYQKAMERAARR